MIPISKPFLPPREDYEEYLKGIWQRNWLTNNGPLVNELELKLKQYLGVPHLLFINNGTIALQIAIKALDLRGEIITTPFTYIATVSSISWENCQPVFVDIQPDTLNIDPSQIEKAITKNTRAILATHVYGNSCDIDAIQAIAKKHDLKVIYDAAHCFGSAYKERSLYAYGDISIASFHATKLFHTVEGGAVFTGDGSLLKKMAYLRNFGHDGPEHFAEIGTNGKNSEFHAAMGLANLKYVSELLHTRRHQCQVYDSWLMGNTQITKVRITEHTRFNFAYYPILLSSEEQLLAVMQALESSLIYPRRYFYPGLNLSELFHQAPMPVCEQVSRRVLCLPLYHSLTDEEIRFVSRIILRTLNN